MTNVKLILICFLLFAGCAFGIGTQAGTSIVAPPAQVTHDNRTDYSNEITLSVSQDHGLELLIPETRGSVSPGSSFYFPCKLTNTGNGSDIYSFELEDTTEPWSSTLIKDDNLNGLRESSENSPVPAEISLAEDAIYRFFTVLTAPARALNEAEGKTTLKVSGKTSDGGTYVGANGNYYGGPDTASTQVSAQVTQVDTTPPTISNLLLNGRRRFPEDIISSKLTLSAQITDDQPLNLDKIEVWLNDLLIYQGAPSDWKGAYQEDSSSFNLTPPPLTGGTYSLKIIAWDKAGNSVQETISPLYVNAPDDIRVIGNPLNYPNPFAPLKGQKTSIAYVLSIDMDITLYMHNIRGNVVWRRTYPAFEEGGKAGYNEVLWDGISDFGKVLGNGIYIFKLAHNNKVVGRGKVTILDYK
jgi:hypothetical protein